METFHIDADRGVARQKSPQVGSLLGIGRRSVMLRNPGLVLFSRSHQNSAIILLDPKA